MTVVMTKEIMVFMVEVTVVAELTVLVVVEVKVTLVMVDGEMPMVDNNSDGGPGGKEEK